MSLEPIFKSNVDADRMLDGRLLHAVGVAMENAQLARRSLARGTTKSARAAEWRAT